MKFLLDQNLSPLATDWANCRRGKNQQRIIITFDSDFADTIEFPVGSHPGVIRLKVIPQAIDILHSILERGISFLTTQKIEGCLVIY